MNSAVTAKQYENICVLTVSNPPVNAVDSAIRAGLIAAVREAEADPAIKAVVIMGAGRNFIAGADLAEFDGEIPAPAYAPTLGAIEGCRKPVICVIHGITLGAGVEVALAAHYRVAVEGAALGFPEITLGIVPGAGGTQRLPRLVGPEQALALLLGGAPVKSARALEIGLVDKVAAGDPLDVGLGYARELIAAGAGPRPTRDRSCTPGSLGDELVAAALKANARALRGRTAQFGMIEALRAGVDLPFDEGLAAEKVLSDTSLRSQESRALRHMFFAERNSAKVPGIDSSVQPLKVQKVAVVGAGTMGRGIAMAFGDAGCEVRLVDIDPAGLERGEAAIRANYEGSAARGRITDEQAAEAIGRITYALNLDGAADVDLVVEAVFEDMALKKDVLAWISRAVRPEAIIASNTSSLSVTELAAVTAHPDKVIGLHFFSPAHIMKLLEIVRGGATSQQTLLTGLEIARRIRKIPVVSGDGFGFIGNRMMLDGAFREGEQMMLEGAGVDQIDNALEAFGFAMGQSRVNDLAGVDIGSLVRKQLALRESRPDPYCIVSDTLVPMGRIGQKAGKGFYNYTANPRSGELDGEVDAVIERLAAERGIKRRVFTDAEIVERFVLQLINVGADILKEGIAYRAADIDVVWVHGFGFPRHLGGPMFHADTLGLAHVAERVTALYAQHGHYWKPSELLLELAKNGSSFAEFDRAAARGE